MVDYESGRAVPNPQIISKLERALGMWPCFHGYIPLHTVLGVHLKGEKAGQPKMAGRGCGRM